MEPGCRGTEAEPEEPDRAEGVEERSGAEVSEVYVTNDPGRARGMREPGGAVRMTVPGGAEGGRSQSGAVWSMG